MTEITCSNGCGKPGRHFFPPFMGDPGFFVCDSLDADGNPIPTQVPMSTVVLLVDEDNEQTYVLTDDDAGWGADESAHEFKVEVPSVLVARLNSAWATARAAQNAICELLGWDEGLFRFTQVCDEWVGDGLEPLAPPAPRWDIYYRGSDDPEREWPANGPARIGSMPSEAEAQGFIDHLPETFVAIITVPHLQLLRRDRLYIEPPADRGGRPWGVYPSRCWKCGHERSAHVDTALLEPT